jgi:flagellar biosynthesis protein FliR
MNDLHSILDHLPAAMLVIFRIGGLMIYGPVFGSAVVPVRIRIFLAFIIGLATYPLLSSQHITNLDLQSNLWLLAPMIAVELMIGLIIGFLASVPLLAMETGGLIMGQQMGLGFARFYNPAIDDEADILGQILFFMALAMFLMIGGLEWMVMAVLHSFEHIHLGAFRPDVSLLELASGLVLSSLELAMRVALPLLALIFLETVAMGFLAKTVPQLNVLSLGFPIRLLLGMLIVAVGLVVISDVALAEIKDMFSSVLRWMASISAADGGET